MGTDYPTSIDRYNDPTLWNPVPRHDGTGEHSNAYDAIIAIEETIGVTGAFNFGTGGGGAFAGTSPQNPVWLAPVNWIYQNQVGTIDPYTYDNGSSGVGATTTQTTPADGVLSIDGGSPSVGDRVLVNDIDAFTPNGIYTVTAVGDGSSVPWVLTRATDNDTESSLIQFWAVTVTGTGSSFPSGSQAIVTLVGVGAVGTGAVGFAISAGDDGGDGSAVALGSISLSSHIDGVAIGADATSSAQGAVAVGSATASGSQSVAFGVGAVASGSQSLALSTDTTASGDFSAAISPTTVASGTGSTALGRTSLAYAAGQTVLATDIDHGGITISTSQKSVLCSSIGVPGSGDNPLPMQNGDGLGLLVRFVDADGNPAWDKTALLTGTIIARRTDTPGTNSVWTWSGIVCGDGVSAYTWLGGSAPTPSVLAQDAGAAAWTVAITLGADPLPSSAAAVIATLAGDSDTGIDIAWHGTTELTELGAG